MTKLYTGIGSRETPDDVLLNMRAIASELAKAGYTLRSGAAQGADTAFELGAKEAKGKMEIYLPWNFFNKRQVDNKTYMVPSWTFDAELIAKSAHPAWHRCKEGAQLMHMRNVSQILGLDSRTPTDFVVCWTPRGSGSGGTGQAIRIAKALNIPVFDLGHGDHIIDDLIQHVEKTL